MDEITKLRGELWFSQGVESMLWRRLGLSAQEMDGFTPTVWTAREKIKVCKEILKRLKSEVDRREKIEAALYQRGQS